MYNMGKRKTQLRHFRPYTSGGSAGAENSAFNLVDCIYMKESTINSTQNIVLQDNYIEPVTLSPERSLINHSRAFSCGYQASKTQKFHSELNESGFLLNSQKKIGRKKTLNTPDIRNNEKRVIRCNAINNLLSSCDEVKNSSNLNRIIDKERFIVRNWCKTVDKITDNLVKFNNVNAYTIKDLYYYNKFSDEEIIKEIHKLKNRKIHENLNPSRNISKGKKHFYS